MKLKPLYAAVLVVVGAGLIYTWAHATKSTPESAPPGEPASISSDTLHYPAGAPQLAYLRIEAVHLEPAPLFAPVTARLAYDEDRTYRAVAPVGGRVTNIYVAPGDHVSQGQALARIDSPDYGSALADNQEAQADLRTKRAAYERSKDLLEAGVMARKDYEAAESDFNIAQAEAQRTADHIHELGPAASGRAYVLRSRIAGIVSERSISAGQEVNGGDGDKPLFVVTDPSRLWLSVDIAERDIARIHRGQRLDVHLDAMPEQPFSATINAIGIALDPATRRLPVTATVNNEDGHLHPEMYAKAYPVDEQHAPMIVLPNSAIFTKGLYSYVWVETKPGTLQRRRVTPALQLQDKSYISEGIAEGERVVTTGALLLEADTSSG